MVACGLPLGGKGAQMLEVARHGRSETEATMMLG